MTPGDIYQTPNGEDAVVLHVDGDTAWIRPVRGEGGKLITAAELDEMGARKVPPLDVEANRYNVRHDVQTVDGRQTPGVSITVGPRDVFLPARRALNLAAWLAAHVDPELVHLRRARDNYVDPVEPDPDAGTEPAAEPPAEEPAGPELPEPPTPPTGGPKP